MTVPPTWPRWRPRRRPFPFNRERKSARAASVVGDEPARRGRRQDRPVGSGDAREHRCASTPRAGGSSTSESPRLTAHTKCSLRRNTKHVAGASSHSSAPSPRSAALTTDAQRRPVQRQRRVGIDRFALDGHRRPLGWLRQPARRAGAEPVGRLVARPRDRDPTPVAAAVLAAGAPERRILTDARRAGRAPRAARAPRPGRRTPRREGRA